MDKDSHSQRDIGVLVNNLKDLTNELTALHSELYWLAMKTQDGTGKETPADLNVDLLTALKGAVDNMRILLWKYIEAASRINPEAVRDGLETQRLLRVTEFLELLRDRLGHGLDDEPMSFIERINARVKEQLDDDRAA